MSRKGFNFYRSYFDVAMELPDKDRLAFYDALAKRQFLGEEPTLTGMAKLAYISQKYVIDAQVKGWEDKTGTSLKVVEKQEVNTPCQGGCQGGDGGGSYAPSVQEKEKEKEEVKEKVNINIVSPETKIKNEAFEKFNKADAWILKVDMQYREIISMFVDYKKSKNQAYKNEKSFMLMANKLISMSNNNPNVARQIVEQSMINNWSGLFELKQNNNKSYEQTAIKTRKKLY